MTLIHHGSRVRSTVGTRRRDNNVRDMIAALRSGSMARDELRDLLNASSSCNSKYIALLRAEGVVELERFIGATRTSPGEPVYRLVRDTERVDAYVRSLDAALAAPARPVAPVVVPCTRAPWPHPSRIHRLEDDKRWPLSTPQWDIPAHEPVLAAFFGIGQAV